MKLKNATVIAARVMIIIAVLYAFVLCVAALLGEGENIYQGMKNGILIWVAGAVAVVIIHRIAEVHDDRESEKRD